MRYIVLLIIGCLQATLFCQTFSLTDKDHTHEYAILFSVEGESTSLIDTLLPDENNFYYYLGNYHQGLYRVAFSKHNTINFINDRKDIVINASVENTSDYPEIVSSESNKIYYEFVDLNKNYKTKTELLQLILARYPKDDNYYQTTVDKVEQLQNEYKNFVNSVIANDPSSFISKYAQSSQLPIVDYTRPVEEQLTYLKSHALDKVDFNDAELIYSDCFTNKSIEYLTYYQNPQLPKQLLEQEFQKAVDTLLTKASVNNLVYQHIADYLVDGFKQFGFDNIVDYIVENYVVKDDLCLDEETENSIENRINQSKLLKVGSTAPNIILPDISGKEIDVSKIEKEKILLLFYASWCPHCQDILPEIYNLYKTRNDFEVVAISLDEEREAWLNFIKDNDFDWINLSDFKG